MQTIEQLREEIALLKESIGLIDALKAKRSGTGVQSKVAENLDSPQNLVNLLQGSMKGFKGRSYLDTLNALQCGEYRK